MAGLVLLVGSALLRRLRPRRLVVSGPSMAPTLLEGDRVLVVRTGAPHPGDVVAFGHPRRPGTVVVKRVVRVDTNARPPTCEVAGDNRGLSTDSRDFGPVDVDAIIGRAVWRYAPRGRTGSLRRRA